VVGNAGPSTAPSISVTDPTPVGLTVVSVSGACSSLPCTIASIASGGSASINVTYSVPSNATGVINNTASISSGGDPNPANNSSTVTTTIFQKADMSVTKTGPSTATVGS